MEVLISHIALFAYEPGVIEFLKLICPLTFQLKKILACITPSLKVVWIGTVFNESDRIRRIQLMTAYHTGYSLSVTTVNLKSIAHLTSF